MKRILLSVCCLLCFGGVYSQTRVSDFTSVMTSAPIGRVISITDVNYIGGGCTFDSVEERLVRPRRLSKRIRDEYATMGRIIDSQGLIDYRADTLYVLSYLYIPSGTMSEYFKVRTTNAPFYFVRDASGFVEDASGNYVMKFLENQYDSHTAPRFIESDSLFYDTVYSWDIEKLIRMIKASGGADGSENFIDAIRIIIQNESVVRKDIIRFKPSLFWHL